MKTCMITKVVAATMVAVLVAASPLWAVTLPFSEDFSGSAPDFSFIDSGAWSIGGGTLNNSATGHGNLSSAPVQLTGDLSTTGIRMSTTVTAGTLDGNTDIGFGAFGTTAAFDLFAAGDNHYLADFKATGAMRILQIPGGNLPGITTIAEAPAGTVSFSTAETYELIFEAVPLGGGGFDLRFTIEDPSEAGPITIAGTDLTPLTGTYFGYRTRVDTGLGGSGVLAATFDDFTLTVAVPEPASIALWGMLGLVGVGVGSWRRRQR